MNELYTKAYELLKELHGTEPVPSEVLRYVELELAYSKK